MSNWETTKDGKRYGASLDEGQVVIWESSGNPHSEIGSSYSYEMFIKGEAQSFIRHFLGEQVLNEIIEAVKARQKNK